MYTINYPTAPRTRTGFTLVELLVAIAIMGVLVGMVLFSLAGAQTDSKIARTKGTIEKINAVILEEWEKFRYRAAKIEIDQTLLRRDRSVTPPGPPALTAREGARLRMNVLRDLMRMEMPDRYSDLVFTPALYTARLQNGNAYQPPRSVSGKHNILRQSIGLSPFPFSEYSGQVEAVYQLPANTPVSPLGAENEIAELLYLIVSSATTPSGSPLEGFTPSEIGDTDGDTFPEFLDAWGNPIRWIRWPAGLASPLNEPFDQDSNSGNPDAMDPLRTDRRWGPRELRARRPWLLVPLVVSAGPDGEFGIAFDYVPSEPAPDDRPKPDIDVSGVIYARTLDPYFGMYSGVSFEREAGIGTYVEGGRPFASDNITNHALILE